MQRIIGLLLISLLFVIKRDGYFPFNENSGELLIFIGNTLLLILFILGVILVVRPFKMNFASKIFAYLEKHIKSFAVIIIISNVLCIFLLTIYTYTSFKTLYSINYPVLILLTVIALILPLFFILKQKPGKALISIFISSFLLSCLAILFFPITAKVSDLLPIVTKQGEAILSGQNIYQYYLLDNGTLTQAVRQPGIILLYLPASILGLDIRLMSIIYILATGVVLLKFVYPKFSGTKINRKFYTVFILLTLFLLMPYRNMRFDLYEPPFWFIFISGLYALYREKLKTFAVLWGVGICTQVWCWIATPFIVLYIFRKYNLRKTIWTALMYLSIGFGVLAIFIIPDYKAYLEHVFGFFQNTQNIGNFPKVSMFLTPWIFLLGLGKYLQIIQIFMSAIVGLFALKYLKTFVGLLFFLAVVILVFIQFLIISWTYMYLNIFYLLLIFALLKTNDNY